MLAVPRVDGRIDAAGATAAQSAGRRHAARMVVSRVVVLCSVSRSIANRVPACCCPTDDTAALRKHFAVFG